MSTRAFWLSILTLILLSGLIALMIHFSFKPYDKKQAQNEIDGYLLNTQYVKYDETGLPTIYFNTPRLLHYPKQDTSHFIQPNILMYTQKRVPWHITSKTGNSKDGTDIIHLNTHVILHQKAFQGLPETTIKTPKLTVYPDQMLATTKAPAVVIRPDSEVHGVGVRANLKTGVIKLLSQSTGIYHARESIKQKNSQITRIPLD